VRFGSDAAAAGNCRRAEGLAGRHTKRLKHYDVGVLGQVADIDARGFQSPVVGNNASGKIGNGRIVAFYVI